MSDNLCVICDIDGTLADHSHRLHLVRGPKKDWMEFFRLIREDKPKIEVINTYHCLLQGLPAKGVLVSGRPEKTRRATEHWLNLVRVQFDLLLMRPDNDNRPDEIVKSEILDRLHSMNYLPYIVLDDRSKVVAMWRQRGLTCLQVAQHDE